jgi:hypothetical protein
MNAITRDRPILTESERTGVRQALRLFLPSTASEEAIAREWAQHYWDNHAMAFQHGDPVDAIPEVPVRTLKSIADYYESDYRHPLDRRD